MKSADRPRHTAHLINADMTFCDDLPETVTYRGRVYRLRAAFDNVLCALRTLDDTDLTPAERRDIALSYLIDGRFPRHDSLLLAVLDVLELNGNGNSVPQPRILDLFFDTPYIYAAFRQAYGIDLYEERGRMHWLKFHALLSAIPQGTRLHEIMRIRGEDIPPPDRHNARQREALIKAKMHYRLPVPEVEARKTFENAFKGLISSYKERGDI